MITMSDQDFNRCMKILMDLWVKAGEEAIAKGFTGREIVKAQEATLNAFMVHISENRKGKQ